MRIYLTRPIRDRFNEKWIPEPNSGCWLWIAGTMIGGYGSIFIRHEGDDWKTRRSVFDGAHRVSWILHRGEIPENLRVCHHCDTPSCVNPSHLFLGTASDNTNDSIKKGRFVFKTIGGGKNWAEIRKISNNPRWPRKTSCSRGHKIEGDNLYITKYGQPRCRICTRIWAALRQEKQRAT